MIAMRQENTLLPDLVKGANPSEGMGDPSAYVSGVLEKLREVHQRVAPTAAPTHPNPYQLGSLI